MTKVLSLESFQIPLFTNIYCNIIMLQSLCEHVNRIALKGMHLHREACELFPFST